MQSNLNGLKALFFNGGKTPGAVSGPIKKLTFVNLSRAAQILALADYLQDDKVASIYKKVSTRVRQAFINFGTASTTMATIANVLPYVDWAMEYDTWEEAYLDGIKISMFSSYKALIDEAVGQLDVQIEGGAGVTAAQGTTKIGLQALKTQVQNRSNSVAILTFLLDELHR